jgi:hypothetical protein
MADAWFYLVQGTQSGPVDAARLRQMAASGELQPDSMLWKEGLAEWIPASRLNGLFAATTVRPPPPPPNANSPAIAHDSSELTRLQSTIKTLQIVYAVLFGISVVVIVLQVVAIGFNPVSTAFWAILLCGAVAVRLYRSSLVNRHNRLAAASGYATLI